MHRLRSPAIAGLIAFGLLQSGLVSGLPEWVRIGAAFVVVIWLPGAIARKHWFTTRIESPLLRLCMPIMLGASLLSIVTWLCMLAGLGFATYRVVVTILLLLTYLASLAASLRHHIRTPSSTTAPYGIIILALLAGAIVALLPADYAIDKDSHDHVGYVRQIVATGEMIPAGVLAPPADDPAPPPRDPRKGALHPAYALLSEWSGASPWSVWLWLPVVMFPVGLLLFLAFCEPFIERRWQLAACGVLFVFCYGGVGYRFSDSVLQGQNLAVMWYWLLVPLTLAAARAPDLKKALMIGVFCTGGALAHAGVVVHAGILFVTVAVFAKVLGVRLRGVVRACSAGLAGLVVVAIWNLLTAGQVNQIHGHLQGVLFVTGDWFVASPLEILRWAGLLFLGGIVLTPVALFFVRSSLPIRRQLAFAAIPLAVSFIPFLTVPAFRAASYMVFRTVLNVPVFALIIVVVTTIVVRSRRSSWPVRVGATVFLFLWANAFVAPTARALVVASQQSPSKGFAQTHPEVAAYIAGLPSETVILSDTRTSYALSALTDHRFVAILEQHANPYDRYAYDRLRAARDALSPFGIPSLIRDACTRYDVDIVILNGTSGAVARRPYSVWDDRFFTKSLERLASLGGSFREVFRRGDVVVLLYDAEGRGEGNYLPPDSPLQFDETVDSGCRVRPADGNFEIVGIDVSPRELLPGEEASVTVAYRKTDTSSFGLPYVLHIRFDHESLGNAGGGVPGEKYLRRFRERLDGAFQRFRRDRVPFDGIIPPELWPIGTGFSDKFAISIPPAVKRGTYRVELSVERVTLLPNFTLRDLLFNRDHYSGKQCTTIEVTDHVER